MTEEKVQVEVIRQHRTVVGSRHRANCSIDQAESFVEGVSCGPGAWHLRFVQQRNRLLQNAPGLLPFSAREIGKVADFSQDMGDRIQRAESPQHSQQQIVVRLCVLACSLECLDTVAIDCADSEEYKEIRVDQQPGSGR
jgi:hypothetical protein